MTKKELLQRNNELEKALRFIDNICNLSDDECMEFVRSNGIANPKYMDFYPCAIGCVIATVRNVLGK